MLQTKKDSALWIFTLIMEKAYNHYLVDFLLSLLEGTSTVDIKVRILNKDLMAKKKVDPINEFLFKLRNSSMTSFSQKIIKNFPEEQIFLTETSTDQKTNDEIIGFQDKILSGCIIILKVFFTIKIFF